jgi:hypothetical protein
MLEHEPQKSDSFLREFSSCLTACVLDRGDCRANRDTTFMMCLIATKV